LDRRLGGPQRRSGSGGEEKNSQPLLRLEPPIIQPVAQRYTIELTRLLCLKKSSQREVSPEMSTYITGRQVLTLSWVEFLKFQSKTNLNTFV
jgi:hypothetical protein